MAIRQPSRTRIYAKFTTRSPYRARTPPTHWGQGCESAHEPRHESRKNLKRHILSITGALTLGALATTTAFAADSVTQSVTGAGLTASVADLALGAVGYSHAVQNSPGTMTLSADDSTGSGAGWNVTIMTSAFAHSGSGPAIPAANFSLSSAAAPSSTAGQAVDGTGGPHVPTTSPVGTLDSARKTVSAEVGFGQGTYLQELGVNLEIPAQSLAGTYTGTLTTTIAAAP